MMLSEPLLLQGIIIYLWRKQLLSAVRFERREMIPQVSAAFATISLVAASLLWMSVPDITANEVPPFPGERIRTALTPPDIHLLNQHGEPVRLADYQGGIVLLTAIYSTCSTSCPMLVIQAQRALEELTEEEREQVTVMAISLDPERDSLELMAQAAAVYGLDAPEFQFLNGHPDRVNEILDHLNVSRMRNKKTDEIDHANLYFLIDRDGKIAYRLTLSDRHQAWLVGALRQLLNDREVAVGG
jgi:protein SCO1